jgi:hypothetical protein
MIIKRNDSDLMVIYLNQLKDKCYCLDYKYLHLINSVKMIQCVFKYLIKIKFTHLESYLEYFIEICIDNKLIYGLIHTLVPTFFMCIVYCVSNVYHTQYTYTNTLFF